MVIVQRNPLISNHKLRLQKKLVKTTLQQINGSLKTLKSIFGDDVNKGGKNSYNATFLGTSTPITSLIEDESCIKCAKCSTRNLAQYIVEPKLADDNGISSTSKTVAPKCNDFSCNRIIFNSKSSQHMDDVLELDNSFDAPPHIPALLEGETSTATSKTLRIPKSSNAPTKLKYNTNSIVKAKSLLSTSKIKPRKKRTRSKLVVRYTKRKRSNKESTNITNHYNIKPKISLSSLETLEYIKSHKGKLTKNDLNGLCSIGKDPINLLC